VRFKIVPPPRSLADLRAMARALPAVPRGEADCCAILADAGDLTARDDARAYLTFLRALGLVAVEDDRYYRVRPVPDDATVAGNFRERVFAADAVLDALPSAGENENEDGDGNGVDAVRDTPDAVFRAVRDRVPRWERHRHEDWEAEWRDRIAGLLDWAVELGIAERVGTDPVRYRRRGDST